MTRIALVLTTFDGVETLYCGVGAVTQYVLASLPSLARSLHNDRIRLTFHVLYAAVPSNRFGAVPAIAERTRLLAEAVGVSLVPLAHCTEVANAFGNRRSWPEICEQAARYIRALVSSHDSVVVIATDTPFAGLPRLLREQAAKRVRVVWVAQSTGRVWASEHDPLDAQRDEWEMLAVAEAQRGDNCFVGSISRYMAKHFSDDWGLPTDRILPFENGVSTDYLTRFECKPPHELASILASHHIPTSKELFLSFARAQWYKGLDLAAQLGRTLALNNLAHPVILALDDGTGAAAETIESIRRIFVDLAGRFTLLTDYPTLLPRWIMQWESCRAVAVMSRREPFGLIPSEYRVLGPSDGLTVTSDAGGLKEQTQDPSEGLVLGLDLGANLRPDAHNVLLARWRGPKDRLERPQGAARVHADYDQAHNLEMGLRSLL
jgi:hypothetical protein